MLALIAYRTGKSFIQALRHSVLYPTYGLLRPMICNGRSRNGIR